MIGKTAFEHILNEYDRKRLSAKNALEERKTLIYGRVPRIKEIEDEIASLSVSKAVSKIKGLPADADYDKKHIALVEEKTRLLEENGFSKEDMLPHYECDICDDTGYVNDEMCSCLKAKIAESLYDRLDIKEVVKAENFEHYCMDYYSKDIPRGESESPLVMAANAVRKAQEFIHDFDSSSDNLYIFGDTGVGKTFLTNCIVKELIEKNYFVIYLSAEKFFELMSDATFNKTESDNEYIIKNIDDCDLLVIDDLGTELTNTFTVNKLFNCINQRLISKRHTIITTNLSTEQLRTVYGERIYSRITASYRLIKLIGDDIRIKKKLEE